MKEYIITDARVIDPLTGRDGIFQVGIRDGIFADPAKLKNPEIISLPGKVLCPGFVDIHVHLRDPGQTAKEDLASGTAAAADGGFTSILAMPNTLPPADSPEMLKTQIERCRNLPVHVMQSAAMTLGRQGLQPSDLQGLKCAGAAAFTDDGSTTQSPEVMEAVMAEAARLGIPVIDHCEDTALSKPGVMHQGRVSEELGLPGQPRAAEENIVERDIRLAEKTGCRLHLQHLSSAGSVKKLAVARAAGLKVTGEVTPHHLLLTDEYCRTFGTDAKMAPPLREEEDRLALIQGLKDGVLTAIATDHAPHTAEEKAKGWQQAPFGIIGIEAAVPLCLTELYHKGHLTLMELVALFTTGPREILGLPIGSLNVGEPADLTVLDLDTEFTLDTSAFKSKSRNCPYNGRKCKGRATATFLGKRS